MVFLQTILTAIAGTSLMTLYSYLIAEVRKNPFKEPVLLNELISRSTWIPFSVSSKSIAGWGVHYSIGLGFSIIYYILWQWTPVKPILSHGVVLGGISGIIGIGGWYTMFRLNANPPDIDWSDHYLHLLIAHIIFGIGAVLGYQMFI